MPCPWEQLPQTSAEFCEASLCAWIREPGNTWSNAGFLVVGVMMLRATRDPELRHLRGIGWITLVTAVGSTVFHATETSIGAFLDYLGMFMGGAFMVVVCFLRITHASRRAAIAVYLFLLLSALGVYFVGGHAARMEYMSQGALCIVLETALLLGLGRAREYRWLGASWAMFIPAMVIWTMDIEGTWCDPDNHVLSGHAAWHLLNAGAFWFTFLYYRQFDVLRRLHGDTIL